MKNIFINVKKTSNSSRDLKNKKLNPQENCQWNMYNEY